MVEITPVITGWGSRLQGLPTHDADDDQHDGGNDESRDGGKSNGVMEITLVITNLQVQSMSTRVSQKNKSPNFVSQRNPLVFIG